MSISSDSSALRAATDPARPVWSLTVAPAFSRTCIVIWPSINCSVNSLEPTVTSASERFTFPEVPPPPPQPAAIMARTAMSPTSRNRFTLFVCMFTPPRSSGSQKRLPRLALQPPGAKDIFGHPRQPVDKQGQNGCQPAGGDQHHRPVQPYGVVDHLSQAAGSYERHQRGGAHVNDQGCPDAGEDDGNGQRQLDAEQHRQLGHSHAAGCLDDRAVDLLQPHHGIAQNGEERIGHEGDYGGPEPEVPGEGEQGEQPDGRDRLAYVGQRDYERRHPAGVGSGEQYARGHGEHHDYNGGYPGELDEPARLLDDGARVQRAPLDAVEVLAAYVQVERQAREPEKDGHREVAQQARCTLGARRSLRLARHSPPSPLWTSRLALSRVCSSGRIALIASSTVSKSTTPW